MSEELREEALEERSVTFEWDLPEAPEKVWRALTDAEIVSEWLGPNDLRPEPGAQFTVYDPWISKAPVECEVLTVDPGRSIVFGWRDADARRDGLSSTVTFELDGTAAGGTHLRIVHDVRHAARPATEHRAVAIAANDNCMQLRLAA
jgi:uncharacterized protein YndB with AHSA1/START domain